MNKEEIKEYLKRVEELEEKLEGEDSETLQWLIFGYNQCARLLNETEQENKQLKENNMSMQEEMVRTWGKAALYKEVIDEVREAIDYMIGNVDISEIHGTKLKQMLDGVGE